jgi:hypothetical protein
MITRAATTTVGTIEESRGAPSSASSTSRKKRLATVSVFLTVGFSPIRNPSLNERRIEHSCDSHLGLIGLRFNDLEGRGRKLSSKKEERWQTLSM